MTVLRKLGCVALAAALGALAGCGSSPSQTISLSTGANAANSTTNSTTSQAAGAPSAATPRAWGDVRAVPVRSTQTQPGCQQGKRCPTLVIDSVAFPDVPGLTEAVDRGLAGMTGVDENLRGAYQNLAGYAAYFWRTAQINDRTEVQASLRGVAGSVVSVQLDTSQMLMGAAHPIPATRFLLWNRATGREISLNGVLTPGRHAQYVAALRVAHGQWLRSQPAYKADPAGYDKLWPFVESDNAALTDRGLVVRYDAYTIAPYSSGEPELTLPWESVREIVRPEFLPN